MKRTLALIVLAYTFALSTLFAASVSITKDTYTNYVSEISNFGVYGTTDAVGLVNLKTLLYLDFDEGTLTNEAAAFAPACSYDDNFTYNTGYDGTLSASLTNKQKSTVSADFWSLLSYMTNTGDVTIDFMIKWNKHPYETSSGNAYLIGFMQGSTMSARIGFMSDPAFDDDNFEYRFQDTTGNSPVLQSVNVMDTNEWIHILGNWNSATAMGYLYYGDGTTSNALIFTRDNSGGGKIEAIIWNGGQPSDVSFNAELSGFFDAEIDNFRVANVCHTNYTTNTLPHEGHFVTTNLNADVANDVQYLGISFEGFAAAEGVSNVVWYSLSGGSEWVKLGANQTTGIYFDARTNVFSSSNDLRIKVQLGTTDDRKWTAFDACTVNYFNAGGDNSIASNMALSVEGVLSAPSTYSNYFDASETTIILDNTTPLVMSLLDGTNTVNAVRFYFFSIETNESADGYYSNEVTSTVAVTNDKVYIPFPTNIAKPVGQYAVYINDATFTGESALVSPVLEVLPPLPTEEGTLLSPYANVIQSASDLAFQYYSLFGNEGAYTLRFVGMNGRVFDTVEGSVDIAGNYVLTFANLDYTTLKAGVYFIVFTVGEKTERTPVIVVK